MVMVAVLIGVSQDPKVNAGRYSVSSRSPLTVSGNLKAIAQVLQESEIGSDSQLQITELMNPAPEKMRQSIEQLFGHEGEDELRLLYFCGSGWWVGKTGKLYLSVGSSESASASQPGQFWGTEPTMISLDWVLELMERCHGEKVAVILDCIDAIDRRPQVSEKISCRSFTQGALLSHLTFEPNQISQDNLHPRAILDRLEQLTLQGDFPTYTDYLVAGLATGEADIDGDGVVSLGEWHQYAQNQFQIFAPDRLPKIYAAGNAANMAVSEEPHRGIANINSLNPYLEYRQTVAELAQRHDGRIPLVVQRSLDVRRDRLKLAPAIAKSIEKTVLAPYQYQQIKLQIYQELWQEVREPAGAIAPETLTRLKYLQQVVLGLTDAEVAEISSSMPKSSPKSSSSDDRHISPLIIMAGLAIALLFGGGSYALISNYLRSDSSKDTELPVSTTKPTNTPEPSVTLPSPPTENTTTEPVKGENADLFGDRFRIPTRSPITLTDHTGSVQAVAAANDRQIIVTGSADKTIKLWDLARVWSTDPEQAIDSSQFLLGTLRGHTGRVRTLAISSDGQTLASGSNDRTIKLWNLAPQVETRGYGRDDESAYLRTTLTDHVGAIYALAFLPDQNILISGSGDWTIKIWDLTTNQVIKTLRGHQGSIRALAVSADGYTLVSGSSDGTVKVWDLRTRELKQTFRGHTDVVRTVAISPDGQTIVSGSWDETIKIWSLQPNNQTNNDRPEDNQDEDKSPFLIGTLTGHTSHVNSAIFSPDGQTLISGSDDNTIKVWQLNLDADKSEDNREVATLQATLTDHSSDILSLAIGGDDWQHPQSYPLLVSGSWDESVKIWW